jgi:uncharacterized membrane protein YhhN
MSSTIVAGLALTGAGLVATLAAEWMQRRALLYAAKPAASVGFLLVALVSGSLDAPYGRWVLAGLSLSLLGDVFLMLRAQTWFLSGLVSFLLAHIAYVGAFLVAGVAAAWTAAAAAGALVAAWVVVRWLLPHLEAGMRGPVMAYVVVISVMVSLAVGTLGAGGTALIVVGAVLFYVSDLFVARDRFVTEEYLNTLIGLPLYYGAQVLLALSVGA